MALVAENDDAICHVDLLHVPFLSLQTTSLYHDAKSRFCLRRKRLSCVNKGKASRVVTMDVGHSSCARATSRGTSKCCTLVRQPNGLISLVSSIDEARVYSETLQEYTVKSYFVTLEFKTPPLKTSYTTSVLMATVPYVVLNLTVLRTCRSS